MFESIKARIGIYFASAVLIFSFWSMEKIGMVTESKMMLWIKFIVAINLLISVYLFVKWVRS